MITPNNSKAIKPPLTYKEQIEKFKKRNLIINDEDFAYTVLSHINYYRFTGYALGLHKNDRFFDGVTFEQIYNIYKFDEKLRYMILRLLETIEIAMRTKITYHLVLKYGATDYLQPYNFNNEEKHVKFLQEFKNSQKPSKHPKFVQHYLNYYKGIFPLWVGIELFSFGMLSKFYSNLKTEDRKAVARSLENRSALPITADFLSSWLTALSNLRNICAHFERIYNRPFTSKPKMYDEDTGFSNGNLFSLLLIIKRLLYNKAQWNSFFAELQALIETYNQINLSYMGFPDNWENILN